MTKGKKTIAKIYLIRHGETQENKEGIIQGQMDTKLNETGLGQAQRVAEALSAIEFKAAFSSDLCRASKTAEAILVHHPNVKMVKQPELRERFLGYMEGKIPGPGTKFVAGVDQEIESGGAFSKRALGWWNGTILESLTNDGDDVVNVLAVSHGGFITQLIRALIEKRKAKAGKGVIVFKCFNASITVVEVKDDLKAEIVKFADVAHLEGGNILADNADTDNAT